MLALAAAGCAARTGPTDELVTRVAPVAGAKLVTVLVATTREPAPSSPVSFTARRSHMLRYARYLVSVPPGHNKSEVEAPKGKPDPAKTFAIAEAESVSEPEFLRAVDAEARKNRLGHSAAVFVHGYNYTFEESLFRRAQLSADANIGGAAVLFAWPSAASGAAYVADRDAALASRDGLAHVLTELAARPGLEVLSFSHSLGSFLEMEALRQMRLTGRGREVDRLRDVVLAAPDIDLDVFLNQLATVGRLDPPLTVLVSKDDGALSLSRALAGGRARVGAADVGDPRVKEGAERYGVRVIDISELSGTGGFNHDRYAAVASIYPQLRAQLEARSGGAMVKAGTFLLNASTFSFSRAPETAAR